MQLRGQWYWRVCWWAVDCTWGCEARNRAEVPIVGESGGRLAPCPPRAERGALFQETRLGGVEASESLGPNSCRLLDWETGEPGFEPGLTDPESAVLPLHHSPRTPGQLTPSDYQTMVGGAKCQDRPTQTPAPPPHQPRATSRIIITVKPPITPIVARSTLPLRWASGMSSSATMNIIAPAAKARA